LSSLFGHVIDFTSNLTRYIIEGYFKGNMTENTSVLSSPIGSAGVYSNLNSSLGLWSHGKSNTISVTVQRIGYITISNGSVSTHKDEQNKPATATSTLSKYGNAFLNNHLVPESKLPRTNMYNLYIENENMSKLLCQNHRRSSLFRF
jgi:hypothetical protein